MKTDALVRLTYTDLLDLQKSLAENAKKVQKVKGYTYSLEEAAYERRKGLETVILSRINSHALEQEVINAITVKTEVPLEIVRRKPLFGIFKRAPKVIEAHTKTTYKHTALVLPEVINKSLGLEGKDQVVIVNEFTIPRLLGTSAVMVNATFPNKRANIKRDYVVVDLIITPPWETYKSDELAKLTQLVHTMQDRANKLAEYIAHGKIVLVPHEWLKHVKLLIAEDVNL